MEYQKIINLLNNTPNQSSKFMTEGSVKINDDLRGMYNTNSQIKYKNSMLRSSLCDYSDIYLLVKDDYTTGCLLDNNFFNKHYKMIAINLSKQQELDADSKAIQEIHFTEDPERGNGAIIFFITEEAKETVLDFSQGTGKV